LAFAPEVEVIATRLQESPTSRLEFAETIAVIRTVQLVGVPLQNLERHGCEWRSSARWSRSTPPTMRRTFHGSNRHAAESNAVGTAGSLPPYRD
jgi:hypothetical protein